MSTVWFRLGCSMILYEASVDFDDRFIEVIGTHDETGASIRYAANLDSITLDNIRELTSTIERAIVDGITGLGEELDRLK